MLLQLASMFQWMIRQSAEIVNQMVGVERVLAFKNVEPEAPLSLGSDKLLDPAWPQQGEIDIKDVAVRYRSSLPFALDGASFRVPSGCRIGVVGRTGSGKSKFKRFRNTIFNFLDDVNIDFV